MAILQFIGLMLLLIIIATTLVIVFMNDILTWGTGYITVIAFIAGIVIFGTAIEKFVNNINNLWKKE